MGTSLYDSQNESSTLDYRSAGFGTLEQSMDLTIQGKFLNAITVNAHLSNSRSANTFSQVFGFDYKHGGTTVDAGTIGATLTGNELTPFSRSVEGVMVSRDFGGGIKTTDFLSVTQATTQRGNFRGNGTAGPYPLNASQIVPGSEHLELNGNGLESGKDYNIDYLTGEVTFLNGTIVNLTDTVNYTYEARTYNTTPGVLGGMRWSLQQKSGAAYGLTYIEQKATGGGSTNGNVTQYFAVYGVAGAAGGVADTTYKYQLSAAIDTTFPVSLKWNNEVLTQNVDFVINTDLNYFQLKRELPADTSLTGNASLSFTYRPVLTQSIAGDKSVYGLDAKVPLSPTASVGLVYAGSAAQAADQSGSGMILNSDFHSPSKAKNNIWDLSTTFRSIGEDFSSIDSTSTAFLQAQKGLTTSLKYSPNSLYVFNTSYSDSKVANTNTVSTTTGTTQSTSWADNQNISASVQINLPKLPKLQLTHQETVQDTAGVSGSKSTYANDGVTATWAKGIYGLSGSIAQTTSNGASVFSSAANNSVATNSTSVGGTTLVDQATNGTFTQSLLDATSLTSRLSVSVTPAAWISITSNFGVSKNHTGASGSASDTTSASDSTAHNYGFGVNLQPTPRLILSGQLANTTNGQSTSAFYNTATAASAAGTSTNTAQIVSTLTGQETHSTNLSLQWTPLDNLSASLATSKQLSLIPGSDNTESDTNQFSLSYNPTRLLQFGLATSTQTVTYVGGEGNSNNSSYTLTNRAGPYGKMTFTSSWVRVNYGSATYISSSSSTTTGSIGGITGTPTTTGLLQEGVSTTLTGQVDYALGGRKSLFFRWIGLDQVSPPGTTNDTTSTTSTGASTAIGSTYVSSNYHQDTGTVGFDMRFTDILGFTINYNLIKLTDKDNADYSYTAHTFTTDLSARF